MMVLKQIVAKARGMANNCGARFKYLSESTDSLALDDVELKDCWYEVWTSLKPNFRSQTYKKYI